MTSVGDMSMHSEAIKTSIFHVAPVRKNTEFHKPIDLVIRLL